MHTKRNNCKAHAAFWSSILTSRQRLSEQLPTVAIHHYNKRYIENCSLQPTYRSYQNHSFLYTLPDIPQEGAKPTSFGGGEAHLFWGGRKIGRAHV